MTSTYLDRDDLIRIAADVADRDGWNNLTMSSVAKEVDRHVTSLYGHVDGLEGLRREVQLLVFDELADALSARRARPHARRRADRVDGCVPRVPPRAPRAQRGPERRGGRRRPRGQQARPSAHRALRWRPSSPTGSTTRPSSPCPAAPSRGDPRAFGITEASGRYGEEADATFAQIPPALRHRPQRGSLAQELSRHIDQAAAHVLREALGLGVGPGRRATPSPRSPPNTRLTARRLAKRYRRTSRSAASGTSARIRASVRNSASHSYARRRLAAHSPTLALPPLSPERAAADRTERASAPSRPVARAVSRCASLDRTAGSPALGVGSITTRVPSGRTTACSTASAGTRHGQ